MSRYILIDNYSGYIFGNTGDLDGLGRQETPIDAAQRLDESKGEFWRTYEQHGPAFRPAANEAAYHVFEGNEVVPLVFDGKSKATIDDVERLCHKVAVITITH